MYHGCALFWFKQCNRLYPMTGTLIDVFIITSSRCIELILKEQIRTVKSKLDDIDILESAEKTTGERLNAVRASLRSVRVCYFIWKNILPHFLFFIL